LIADDLSVLSRMQARGLSCAKRPGKPAHEARFLTKGDDMLFEMQQSIDKPKNNW